MCPSLRFNSILNRLPDLSSLQRRVKPFCPRRWPGSVCVGHRHELLRLSRTIHTLRPPADKFVNTPSSNAVDNFHTYLPFRKQVVSSCPRRWPGSVCVDHRHELLGLCRPMQAFRPPPIPNSMQALGRCSPKNCTVVAVFLLQLSKFFNSRVTCWKKEGYVRLPVVGVRSVSRPRLRRARKPTASKDYLRLTTKAGVIWQEWADGRPEQVFAPSLEAPMFSWELSI